MQRADVTPIHHPSMGEDKHLMQFSPSAPSSMSDGRLRRDGRRHEEADWNSDLESGLKIHQDPVNRCSRQRVGGGQGGPRNCSLVKSGGAPVFVCLHSDADVRRCNASAARRNLYSSPSSLRYRKVGR